MKILISSCLLGHQTRYDGKSKPVALPEKWNDAEITHFCPEVAAGFGVPRDKIELEKTDEKETRVVRVRDRADVTKQLAVACEKEIARFQSEQIKFDLIVLKSRSPSCGMRTPLHDANGVEIGNDEGVWAATLREHFPDTPIVDETNL